MGQQQRNRDKAEKTAKNLISAAVKARSRQAKQAAKKGKSKKSTGPEDGAEGHDVDMLEQNGENFRTTAQEIIDKAQAEQLKLDAVLHDHLDRFQLPDTVPLTKLTSSEEKMTRSARGMLMQQALLEAEKAMEENARLKKAVASGQIQSDASDPKPDHSNGVKIGIAAAVAVLAESQSIKGKGKGKTKSKSNSKEEKEVITKELMKMGKHLLK